MEEQEYVELIKSRWPSLDGSEPTAETIALCEQAVSSFPGSAKLWVMRGDLIQLTNYEGAPSPSEVERSYRQAIAVAPSFPDGICRARPFSKHRYGKAQENQAIFSQGMATP